MDNDGKTYAGFWVRIASILVDILLISVIIFILFIILVFIGYPYSTSEVFLKFFLYGILPINVLLSFIYYVYLNANGNQTAGKKLFGLMVVNRENQPISIAVSFFRTIVFILDSVIYGIGHLLMLFTKKKQTLHDIISKTYVINWEHKNRSGSRVFMVILVNIIFIFGIALVIRTYIQAYTIPTSAMENTILTGDYILVDKVEGNKYIPKPGDIVIFRYPENEDIDYIKRCIAVGGQTVEIIDKQVYVNGQLVKLPQNAKFIDPNIDKRPKTRFTSNRYFRNLGSRDNYGPITVPPNAYWVMGDNRDNSLDSRYWGFVPQENIIGKAGLIYYSWDSFDTRIRWERIGKSIE